MKKVEVLFLQNLVGTVGLVRAGFAKHYLIPRGKAVLLSNQNEADLKKKVEEKKKEEEERLKIAKEVKNTIENSQVSFLVFATDDGTVFGSIKLSDITEKINSKISNAGLDYSVENHHISLVDVNRIKFLGDYQAKVEINSELSFKINISVSRKEE